MKVTRVPRPTPPLSARMRPPLPEVLRRDAPALIGHRDRDMLPVAFRRDPDGGGVRGVARGVGEQVVQHLHDALPVGQHGRQVDPDGVPAAAADEGAARLVHQGGDLRGLGHHRERARLDAHRAGRRSARSCGRPDRR